MRAVLSGGDISVSLSTELTVTSDPEARVSGGWDIVSSNIEILSQEGGEKGTRTCKLELASPSQVRAMSRRQRICKNIQTQISIQKYLDH